MMVRTMCLKCEPCEGAFQAELLVVNQGNTAWRFGVGTCKTRYGVFESLLLPLTVEKLPPESNISDGARLNVSNHHSEDKA